MSDIQVVQEPVVKPGTAKVIRIDDVQAGKITETTISTTPPAAVTEAAPRGVFGTQYRSLREAATTSEFPVLLQSGLKAILFDAYNGYNAVYPQIVNMESSDKPAEDYLEGNAFGTLPEVGEGQPYPDIDAALDRTVRIVNKKYGGIFAVTEEMVMFDKVGLIRQMPADLGRALRQTIEEVVFGVLTTSGNYTRNSTTNDNDVGANTGSTTFSAAGLVTALRTIRTMKDRKSGRYLGITPDTLVVTPGLEFAAKQLLLGNNLVRASANNAAEVYGTGQENVFRGLVREIIVTPYMGSSYQWLLFQKNGFCKYQEVLPLRFMSADAQAPTNELFFTNGKLRYRADVMFGVGILNDRLAYYSTSSSAPAAG